MKFRHAAGIAAFLPCPIAAERKGRGRRGHHSTGDMTVVALTAAF